MSEKKNEIKKERKKKAKKFREIKRKIRTFKEELKKNRKLEVILFIVMACSFLFAVLNNYFLYCSETLTRVAMVLMVISMFALELKVIVTFVIEDKKGVMFAGFMLFCMVFFDSSQTSAFVFTFVFELVILKLIFNPKISKQKLEKKIEKYNEKYNKTKNKKYIINSNVFDERSKMSIIIYRLMIYTVSILPMFLYDVIVALGTFKYTVKDMAVTYDIPMEQLNTTVKRITGVNDIDMFIFNFSNYILERYSKIHICMSFMILLFGVVILILINSESVQENRRLYKERIQGDVVKEIRKIMTENKEDNESIIFNDEELICIDEEKICKEAKK